MDTLSLLNYWLTTIIQEFAKPSKERYPAKTLHQIVCGKVFNPLDASDKSSLFYVTLVIVYFDALILLQ